MSRFASLMRRATAARMRETSTRRPPSTAAPSAARPLRRRPRRPLRRSRREVARAAQPPSRRRAGECGRPVREPRTVARSTPAASAIRRRAARRALGRSLRRRRRARPRCGGAWCGGARRRRAGVRGDGRRLLLRVAAARRWPCDGGCGLRLGAGAAPARTLPACRRHRHCRFAFRREHGDHGPDIALWPAATVISRSTPLVGRLELDVGLVGLDLRQRLALGDRVARAPSSSG